MFENKLHQIGREVAANMGLEWSYAAEQKMNHLVYICGPGGSGITIATDSGFDLDAPKRLEIRGQWPEPVDCGGGFWHFYPMKTPSIGCSAKKMPQVIARDILRRFVPDYLVEYRVQFRARNDVVEQENERKSSIQELCDVSGLEMNRDGTRVYLPRGYMEVSVGSGGVTVKIDARSVPFDVALKIVVLLREG